MPPQLRGAAALVLLVLLSPAAAPAATPEQQATELNNVGVRAAQQRLWEAAVDALRKAVALNPADQVARKNLSDILTDWAVQLGRAGQVDAATRLLKEAVEREPSNGHASAILGDLAYFNRGDFSQAIAHWKQAASLLPAAERRALADRIAQAQRDALIERGYASTRTEHFDIRVQAEAGVAAGDFGPVLESVYTQLTDALGLGPSRVSVIVYTEADLRRAYNQRDWAIGFYDGRLRVRADELNTPGGPALIAHELAHAFLHHRYGATLPVWLHEGLAQIQEGDRLRSDEELKQEERLANGTDWVPLKWLDTRFTRPANTADVGRAYVQARLAVRRLLDAYGAEAMYKFLDRLSLGDAVPEAFETAFEPARWASTDRPF